MGQQGVLRMRSLEWYMDEQFIHNAFNQMGVDILGVDMRRICGTGSPARDCLVQFPNDFYAVLAMHKLNRKNIPGSRPPVRFRLSHASSDSETDMDKYFTLWVGNLSHDVDDYALFTGFACHYPSVRLAKVILDNTGISRNYGFVRFAEENEQKKALIEMRGFMGIGSQALMVNVGNYSNGGSESNPFDPAMDAVLATWSGQAQSSTTVTTTQVDYTRYYDQYWQATSQHYGNHYDPTNPVYVQAQRQSILQQPTMTPAAYQATPLSVSTGIQMAYSSQHVGQQLHTLQQPPIMPAAFQAVQLQTPMDIPMANMVQHVVWHQEDENHGPVYKRGKYGRR